MAEELQEELQDLSPEEQEKLKKLMEKDSKSYRSPTGLFKWLVAALGGGMVLFYFYTAGLAAVATQYHRGVYVFVTYVLVFLLYPAGTTRMRIPLSLVIGGIISCAIAALGFYETVDTFHAEITSGSMGLIGAILLGRQRHGRHLYRQYPHEKVSGQSNALGYSLCPDIRCCRLLLDSRI